MFLYNPLYTRCASPEGIVFNISGGILPHTFFPALRAIAKGYSASETRGVFTGCGSIGAVAAMIILITTQITPTTIIATRGIVTERAIIVPVFILLSRDRVD